MKSGDLARERAQAERYLKLLFEHACDDGLSYLIFSLPSRRTRFFKSIGKPAVDYCMRECHDLKQNVYAGMALFRDLPQRGDRGDTAAADAITCVHGDFDVGKEGAPEDLETALSLAVIGPYRPSFHVTSGSGIHAYWLFSEPWIFDDSKERGDADELIKRVNETHRALAEHQGFKLDYIKDLVRVYRVPGTLNYKRVDAVTPVELHEKSVEVQRYDHTDFDPFLVALDARPSPVPGQYSESVGFLHLDPLATIPQSLIDEAIEQDDSFSDTWFMRRKDFGKDVSRYCLSIADIFIGAGLADQIVADAITHFRREIARKPKVDAKGRLRLDWYQMTILKAKQTRAPAKASATIKDGVFLGRIETNSETGKPVVNDSTREQILKDLRSVLRVDIRRFVQIGLDDAQYYVVISGGSTLRIGDDETLESFVRFSRRLRTHFGVKVDQSARKIWYEIVHLLTVIAEVDLSANPRREDEVRSTISMFLNESHVITGDRPHLRAVGPSQCHPFRDGDWLFLHFETFYRWCQEARIRIFTTPADGRAMLKLLGASQQKCVGAGSHPERVKRWYWRLRYESVVNGADEAKLADWDIRAQKSVGTGVINNEIE